MNSFAKRLIALAALLPLSTGCIPWWMYGDDDDDLTPVDDGDFPEPEPEPINDAPTIDVVIPDWPPPGPDSLITIEISDEGFIDHVDVEFRNELTFFPGGSFARIDVAAVELGEGLGDLWIGATDDQGAQQISKVDGLLIDLSPPEITLGETVVRYAEDSEFEIWVADAWVLGHVELTVGEVTLTHNFDDGYPSTLGESWDYSLVQFASQSFPEGTDDGLITLYDAAGNSTETQFELTLDGQAPTVAITSPAPATIVSDLFDVVVDASDVGGGPTWIELRVEGTPVATAVGPTATIQLDAADLTSGAVDLEAVATDQAGNVSVLATVPITVQ